MESLNFTTGAPAELSTSDSVSTTEMLTTSSESTPPPYSIPPATQVVLGVILMFAFLVGMVINPLVINLFRKEKKIHSFNNMYVLALSTSDLLMTLIGLSSAAISTCAGRWVFGDAGCVLHGFTVTFLGLLNLNLFTTIAVDRYLVIVRPSLRAHMSNRAVKLTISLCVLVSLLWSLLPLGGWFGVSFYTYEGIGTSCSLDWINDAVADKVYIVLLFVVFFTLPVIVICVAYSSIYMKVHEVTSANSLTANPTIAEKNAQVERKVAITFFLVFVSFLVSWTPYAVTSLMATSGYSASLSPLAATLPAIFAKVAVVWNPLIYVATNQVIRECFLQLYAPFTNYCTNPGIENSRFTNGNAIVRTPGINHGSMCVVAPASGAEPETLRELGRGIAQEASSFDTVNEQLNQQRSSSVSAAYNMVPPQPPAQPRRLVGRQGSVGSILPPTDKRESKVLVQRKTRENNTLQAIPDVERDRWNRLDQQTQDCCTLDDLPSSAG